MPGFDDFLDLPARASKPRTRGLTHVMDKGLNLRDIEGLFDTAGDFVDIVKLGWGTSYVTANLGAKLDLYRSLEIPVVCGGTLLEVAEARGRTDAYRRWLAEHGFASVEISDGTIEMPRERKLELIDLFARDFRVLRTYIDGHLVAEANQPRMPSVPIWPRTSTATPRRTLRRRPSQEPRRPIRPVSRAESCRPSCRPSA